MRSHKGSHKKRYRDVIFSLIQMGLSSLDQDGAQAESRQRIMLSLRSFFIDNRERPSYYPSKSNSPLIILKAIKLNARKINRASVGVAPSRFIALDSGLALNASGIVNTLMAFPVHQVFQVSAFTRLIFSIHFFLSSACLRNKAEACTGFPHADCIDIIPDGFFAVSMP